MVSGKEIKPRALTSFFTKITQPVQSRSSQVTDALTLPTSSPYLTRDQPPNNKLTQSSAHLYKSDNSVDASYYKSTKQSSPVGSIYFFTYKTVWTNCNVIFVITLFSRNYIYLFL